VQYAPFAGGRPSTPSAVIDEEKRAAATLEQCLLPALLLDRFPKSVIECNALVLEADGSESVAVLLAAALALADAGIDLLDIPSACSVAGTQAGPGGAWTLLVDPTAAETASAAFVTTVAYLPALQTIASAQHAGNAPGETTIAALRLAMEAAVAKGAAMRAALQAAATARIVTL
jgi:exosome complex component MTR3